MRKIFISICLLLSFSLTGCTQSHESEIKKTVNNYLQQVQKGDYEKALSYCTKDVEDQVALNKITSTIKKDLKELGLDSDTEKYAEAFTENISKQFIQNYKIKAVEEENETSKVIVQIKGIDISSVSFDSINDSLESMLDEYISNNSEELVSLFNEKGQEELTKKLSADFIQVLFDKMNETVNDTKIKKSKILFTLNNKYKITKIELLTKKSTD